MAGIVVKLRNCAIPDEELPANDEFRPSPFVLRHYTRIRLPVAVR